MTDLASLLDIRRLRRRPRWLLWVVLIALLAVAQTLLLRLTLDHESNRAQDKAESVASAVAAEMRRSTQRAVQAAQSLTWNDPPLAQWHYDAAEMLKQRREMLRLEWRDAALKAQDALDSPLEGSLFAQMRRSDQEVEMQAACALALRTSSPVLSRSYFVPQQAGHGLEVLDLCIPSQVQGQLKGFVVATLSLPLLMESAVQSVGVTEHEISVVEADGTRLARSGAQRGTGIYQATRLVDVAGPPLLLRADAVYGRPGLIPNLTTALVLGLSLGLFALVVLLARDVRRRARAELALADALAFRRAMEDSLVTGLRARDRQGRVTYVNPAFCDMVGFGAEEIIGKSPPPYWPPEHVDEYQRRQADRLNPDAAELAAQRQGFETLFIRKSGERFPVMIYEAPLLDRVGHHAGWMSAALDVSEQRRMEERSRQQQERLAAAARLASVGEMATLLSHELNQPLAAIASYATGSLNLLDDPDMPPGMIKQALERIAEQAERAGRVIKSVHGLVRRREQAKEPIAADLLIESVMPLVRLQARKTGTRLEVQCPKPAPRVLADRTMVEQVLLNLTRNGLQAMEAHAAPSDRVLILRVTANHARWVRFAVIDRGPGIAPEVASKLFTPFFTTREEGMGLGLSLCRTVIEQHGGVLDFGPASATDGVGCEFRFTLPVAESQRPAVAAAAALQSPEEPS
ncbi:MAG: PAS domain-containing sensor histidine kinase [Ideonella sp. MAG2]|nr:MAG: PAS domain-containing sensor histidine kinase [Ideonella sp. MAG2]